MRLLTTTLILLFGFVALVVANARHDCERDHPKVFKLIQEFCGGKTNMVVPEHYTRTGKVGPKGSRVWIDACRPPQWVPMHICRGQFFDMCAAHRKVGLYGKSGCQTWRIQYAKDTRFPKPASGPFPPKDVDGLAGSPFEGMGEND
ncbi:hypothetical protein CERZMDRAFT_89267 [Cercospora zeae-maydis SCOH1-5]|uniref:Uncharacterized protein n=1 Tax=Cercospora zeae-maydis SCOH1-5 TaxID=717836 RepID=A0A6A6EZ34_9PEZI|nr:hypothetical protein CERZMDRAFT_89267 [Cercospora zeae-maydis SCOH1-5]